MLVRNLLLALGVLALIAGIALAAIWFTQSAPRPATEVKTPPPVRQAILVAAQPIRTGTLLRAEDMTSRDTRPTELRPGSLMRGQEAEFVGAIARRDLGAGDPLIASDFVKPSERGFLAAVLKPGTRAISITVDAPQSSSGLIQPGDRVDVILVQGPAQTAGTAARKDVVAETVLVDVRAIAVDQSLTAEARGAQAERRPGVAPSIVESRLPKTVTLEVTPRQAEVLLVAAQLGQLGLAVRALEGPAAATPAGPTTPTWGTDVSTALRQSGARPGGPPRSFTTGSSIEKSIRTVPPPGAILRAPATTEPSGSAPVAAQPSGNIGAPDQTDGDTQ